MSARAGKPRFVPPEEPRIADVLPVLLLKDRVMFPYIILSLSEVEPRAVLAVEQALARDQILLLVSPADPPAGAAVREGLFALGTASAILRMLKLPDGRIRILVQGLARARLEHLNQTEPFLEARISRLAEPAGGELPLEAEALFRSVKESLERAADLGKGISPEVLVVAANLEEPGRLADLAASNLELKVEDAQEVLATLDPVERLGKVSRLLEREIQLLTMQQEISSQARGEMDRNHREYFLRQQLKAIREELGEGEEIAEEIAACRRQAAERDLPDEALQELERQLRRLERSHPDSAETSVIRTYLDWLTGLPWRTYSTDLLDLDHARRVLDEDHHDLEKVKERILEYLAVRTLNGASKGPILCFVGPPGVGKTSLGRSIARALGRRFARLSLGGVRDEAEIRGHRRTYVGALPGRILQALHQAGTSNPVFMLDEIDKLGSDYRGDPSAALLEVLDPEQNGSFRDHYLGVSYDLSQVMFITTANLLEPVLPAFRDRMEVIALAGYTTEEKLAIARRHLIPKQLRENGLGPEHLRLPEATVRRVIIDYTREAGLRNLERELAAICRKVAMRVARGHTRRLTVSPRRVESLLGPARHFPSELLAGDRVGIATGLAWTEAGGDLMLIEVVAVPGKGQLLLTGHLGEVMKESAQAALSFARAYCGRHGVPAEFFAAHDVHVHVPAGSIAKDGPSAGITIATAIVSVATRRQVRHDVAMTGEITLRGDVLPIGGLKEKVLAARQSGVRKVLLPKLNQRDLAEIAPALRQGIGFELVEGMEQVLAAAFADPQARVGPCEPLAAGRPRRL